MKNLHQHLKRRNTENANKGNLETRVKTSGKYDENRLLDAKANTTQNLAQTWRAPFTC